MDRAKISLVTTCKGRLSYLKESLPTWLEIDYDPFDIVVVDFDCPDKTEDYINRNREQLLEHSKATGIHVVKVNNRPDFNLCEARNMGLDFADSDMVFMIDADIHIKDKGILNFINRRCHEGVVFFSNTAVLCTRFAEGHTFYNVKYGIERIAFHSMLPTHCKIVGLSGTACYRKSMYEACGKYRPEVNRSGWGSHDIEFYIRYLNHFFYKVLLKEKPGRYTDPAKYLDTALKRFDFFPPGSFELVENTTEEKTRFYNNPQAESSRLNRTFIRKLLEEEGDRYGWIKRENADDGTVSVLKYRRYRKFPVPPWFRYYFDYYVGFRLYEAGKWNESFKHLKKVLTFDEVDLYVRWRASFLLGVIAEKLGRNNCYYLNKAYEVVDYSSPDPHLREYNKASVLKLLGKTAAAQSRFNRLLAHVDNPRLVPGIYFHLGEIFFRNRQYIEAGKMFNKTLELNPGHQKAKEYLEGELKEK